jgi:tetratricopeptide (TPR) repeat protein
LIESHAAFRKAEEIQKEGQPELPFLYAFQGFRYCNLLLSLGNYKEVEQRATQTLEIAKQYFGKGLGLLEIAFDNLSLGCALFQIRLHAERFAPVQNPLAHLNRAVDGLRQAGAQEFIARGLLARAEYYRVTGDLVKAQKDVDEAFTIAARGGMGLYLADCHLEYARLNVQRLTLNVDASKVERQKSLEDAKAHLKIAKEMIEKMGYHRRDKEAQELEEQLKDL